MPDNMPAVTSSVVTLIRITLAVNYVVKQRKSVYSSIMFLKEFLLFGVRQAKASIFGGVMLGALILTHFVELPGLHRYDYLFLIAVAFQIILVATKMESRREVMIIFGFHIIATVMELFKTSDSIGSWSYPEPAVIQLLTVPLFAGFMYSAVGSYIARSWRLFSLRFTNYPNMIYTYILATAIYINFFTHHFIFDLRYIIFVAVAVLYFKTTIHFTVIKERKMPMLVGFGLVTFFIWLAENIGTYVNVWLYPHQKLAWELVSFQKFGAWFLLMIISFIFVSVLYRKEIRGRRREV